MIIFAQTFFLSKNIVCRSFLSAFMARALNSIIKSAMFFFLCLNISIFHSASTTFVLLLNIFSSSCTKLSQSWVPLLLDIYACYTLSKVGKNCCDSVVSLYDPIALEEQLYLFLPVFKFHSISIKLFWI